MSATRRAARSCSWTWSSSRRRESVCRASKIWTSKLTRGRPRHILYLTNREFYWTMAKRSPRRQARVLQQGRLAPAQRHARMATRAGRPGLAQEAPLIAAFIDPVGTIAVDRVAKSFGISKVQLAETVGLKGEALYKPSRIRAPKTQSRVREMLEIISLISEWAGGKDQAMAWYRAQRIPAFGGRTAEALVKSGKATAVRDYLDHIAMGGFA